MRPRILSLVLLIAAVGPAAIGAGPLLAQEIPSESGSRVLATAGQHGDWTVVTMAPDGSWGVATSVTVGAALAQAIRNCRALSSGQIGCGAQARTIRSGWIVGLRCGATNIIAAETQLADAEKTASSREAELRKLYLRDLPPCRRVLTVGPHGAVHAAAWRQGRSTLAD